MEVRMPRSQAALLLVVSAAAAAAGACGTSRDTVKPDDMGAAQHREEAAREKEAARQHAREYDPKATVPSPFHEAGGPASGEYAYPLSVYNPTEAQLRRADEHRAHARQHEKAAQELERFEAAECVGFPPAARAACPLLRPVTRIDDLGDGVRVTFASGTPIDAVFAHMRCHYAYARTRAFDDAASCPLYIRGIEIKRAKDPLAIDITTKDWQRVHDLQAHTREEAVYAPGSHP
jgi:hypothetical protein